MDVAVGAAVLSLMLIPALQLMGQSSRVVSDTELKDALLFEAERAIEAKKIELCDVARFDTAASSPDTAIVGNATRAFRLQLGVDVEPTLGFDRLLTLTATAYQDANANARLDPDEPRQTVSTQWSRP